MNAIDAIRAVSDEDLAAFVGGLADDGTTYVKWQNDISPDKQPWPALTPSIPIPPPRHVY